MAALRDRRSRRTTPSEERTKEASKGGLADDPKGGRLRACPGQRPPHQNPPDPLLRDSLARGPLMRIHFFPVPAFHPVHLQGSFKPRTRPSPFHFFP